MGLMTAAQYRASLNDGRVIYSAARRSLTSSTIRVSRCRLRLSEDYASAGRDVVAALSVLDELCTRGTALAGPLVHSAVYAGLTTSASSSEQQQRELLPRVAAGKLLLAW